MVMDLKLANMQAHFNPGPMPLCKHCRYGESFGQAHRCTQTGMVSYFGCHAFEREPGADDE